MPRDAYSELIDALCDLRDGMGGNQALVVDAQGLVWACSTGYLNPDEVARLEVEINQLFESLPKSLSRGGKIDGAVLAIAGHPFYRSFAGICS